MRKSRAFLLIAFILLAFSPYARASDPAPVPSPVTWPAAYAMSWNVVCGDKILDTSYRVDGINSRTDLSSGKFTMTTIFNRDHEQLIMIMNKSVRVFPFSQFGANIPSTVATIIPPEAVWVPLGPDKLAGKDMTKYSVTYSDHVKPLTVTAWVSKDDNILSKIVMTDGTIKTLTSYKPGHQDPTAFEIPKD